MNLSWTTIVSAEFSIFVSRRRIFLFDIINLAFSEKPHNPMVNAGAIIVISLLKSMVRPELTLAEKFDYTLQYFKVMTVAKPQTTENTTRHC